MDDLSFCQVWYNTDQKEEMGDLWTDTGSGRKDSHEPSVPNAKRTMFPYKPSREVSVGLSA